VLILITPEFKLRFLLSRRDDMDLFPDSFVVYSVDKGLSPCCWESIQGASNGSEGTFSLCDECNNMFKAVSLLKEDILALDVIEVGVTITFPTKDAVREYIKELYGDAVMVAGTSIWVGKKDTSDNYDDLIMVVEEPDVLVLRGKPNGNKKELVIDDSIWKDFPRII